MTKKTTNINFLDLLAPRTKSISENIISGKGFNIAHLHLDRVFTDTDKYYNVGAASQISSLTLKDKQNHIDTLNHVYDRDNLTQRMTKAINLFVKLNVKEISSFINIGENLKEDGLIALNVANELKEQYKEKIKFNIGAYPMFGFRNDRPERLELLKEAIKSADFIGMLPERDCFKYYGASREHIGFRDSITLGLKLAIENEIPIHFHIDQQNSIHERGTETLANIIDYNTDIRNEIKKRKNNKEPFVWAVHSISPACYERNRFDDLAQRMGYYNIGLITCPSAAISMRQRANETSPTHNSIADVIGYLANNVHVRVGIDNIGDIFLPMTSPNPITELESLANSIRYYDPEVLECLMSGEKLNTGLVKRVIDHRENYFSEINSHPTKPKYIS
ncbi:MAG: hypothetical protein KC550_03900 [Nanoarchaeota archaeon]|nr:hypothetical protein [Nanoarchaeota archaeon]